MVCARTFEIVGGGAFWLAEAPGVDEGLGVVLSELAEGGTGLVRRPRAVALQRTCLESLAARSTGLIEGGMAAHFKRMQVSHAHIVVVDEDVVDRDAVLEERRSLCGESHAMGPVLTW